MGSDSAWRPANRGGRNFNPRSPDGERLGVPCADRSTRTISIHAPRMGSDHARDGGGYLVRGISIHAPRMGSDTTPNVLGSRTCSFQSTLPGWGATRGARWHRIGDVISIHAPRMGSDNWVDYLRKPDRISIHAPRMGSDAGQTQPGLDDAISIHAPRMGSDLARPARL